MRRDEDFFQQFEGHTIFTGVCEARNDPAMMGRIQVRIFGLHSPDRTEIPTEALPWATIMLPTTMAGMSGVMSTTSAIMEGTWVVGFFRDGPSCQDPVIIGTLLGNASPRWPALSRGESVERQQDLPPPSEEIKPTDPDLDEKEKEAIEEIEGSKMSKFFDRIKEKWESLSLEKKMKDLLPEQLQEIEKAGGEEESKESIIKSVSETEDSTVKEIKKTNSDTLKDVHDNDADLLRRVVDSTEEETEYLKKRQAEYTQ